jgi:hypothetical protein
VRSGGVPLARPVWFSTVLTDGDAERGPMVEQAALAERFEAHRSHPRAVAYRMLGSVAESEDAVQRPGCS